MANQPNFAPGHPGIPPRWTSSAKSGIGASLSSVSRVWFTLSHGILNEIYYPRIDQACVRDMGLLVSAGAGRISNLGYRSQMDTGTSRRDLPRATPTQK